MKLFINTPSSHYVMASVGVCVRGEEDGISPGWMVMKRMVLARVGW